MSPLPAASRPAGAAHGAGAAAPNGVRRAAALTPARLRAAAPPRTGGSGDDSSDMQPRAYRPRPAHAPGGAAAARLSPSQLLAVLRTLPPGSGASHAAITAQVQMCRSFQDVGELFVAFSSDLNHINVAAMVCKISKVGPPALPVVTPEGAHEVEDAMHTTLARMPALRCCGHARRRGRSREPRPRPTLSRCAAPRRRSLTSPKPLLSRLLPGHAPAVTAARAARRPRLAPAGAPRHRRAASP
jgi:hypothetical protein